MNVRNVKFDIICAKDFNGAKKFDRVTVTRFDDDEPDVPYSTAPGYWYSAEYWKPVNRITWSGREV